MHIFDNPTTNEFAEQILLKYYTRACVQGCHFSHASHVSRTRLSAREVGARRPHSAHDLRVEYQAVGWNWDTGKLLRLRHPGCHQNVTKTRPWLPAAKNAEWRNYSDYASEHREYSARKKASLCHMQEPDNSPDLKPFEIRLRSRSASPSTPRNGLERQYNTMEQGLENSMCCESSYVKRSVSDAISSAGLRDFSFKDVTCTKTALRVLDEKVAATFLSLKDDGLLDAYSSVMIEVETCGEQSWSSLNSLLVNELRNALKKVKITQVKRKDPALGFSILQYAKISHTRGRLGAFEVYVLVYPKDAPSPARILLHSKLQTQHFPNVKAIITFLSQALPRVTDAAELKILADDNTDLRHDLQKSTALCRSVEQRLLHELDSSKALQLSHSGMQLAHLRWFKELSKMQQSLDKLKGLLQLGTNEHSLCEKLREILQKILNGDLKQVGAEEREREDNIRAQLQRSIIAAASKEVKCLTSR